MTIVDKYEDHDCLFYTVELEPGIFADIKVIKETGLIYTMQNQDGSLVYKESVGNEKTIPNYPYNEKAAIALVAVELKKEVANG